MTAASDEILQAYNRAAAATSPDRTPCLLLDGAGGESLVVVALSDVLRWGVYGATVQNSEQGRRGSVGSAGRGRGCGGGR